MSSGEGTTQERAPSVRAWSEAQPGVLVTLIAGVPAFRAHPIDEDPLVIGRGVASKLVIADEQLSRQHLSIYFSHETWTVEELGSRNATYVNGTRVEGKWRGSAARSVRAGQTVIVLERDLSRLARTHRLHETPVVGPSLQAALDVVGQAARDGLNVLVTGETGTGKELAAAHFHAATREGRPFRQLNCAAVAEQLLESELFGHARGAFSSANQARAGLFEAAHGGTLFFDELGEMPLAMQAKLLRAVQEKEVRRIGENESRRVDVRFVAATNRDLLERVRAGAFREDLYYRLAESIAHLPPLRERPEEISYLAGITLQATEPPMKIDSSLIDQCLMRAWPGNVRELIAAVRAAASTARLSGLNSVSAGHLPVSAGLSTALRSPIRSESPAAEPATRRVPPHEAREAAILAAVRDDPGADVAALAVQFGISASTVYRILQKHKAR